MPSPLALSPSRPSSGGPRGWSPVARARTLQRAVFLFVILTAQLMMVLDSTIVTVALPHIQAGLGFSASGLSWVLNAYVLAFGGLLLLGARGGDLLGRRRVFLSGIALFTLSSLVGGLAETGWMLLGTRALQGVGAALVAPSALSLLTTAYPEGPRRVRAIALYTTVSAAGAAVGLLAGGLLTELASWRWVMFVNVPIGLAVLLCGRGVLTETERRRGRFDLAGALTSTLGMGGLVLGLVEAGTTGWASGDALVPLALGAVLLAGFLVTEARASEPILPLRLLTHPTRTTANAARGLVYAGMYGMFFFLSQFLQDLQGFSPIRAGVAFLPVPLAVFLSSQLTSRVLVRRLREKVVMALGIALAAGGMAIATGIHAGAPYGQVVASLVLLGAGSGISFVSLTTASLAEVAPGDAGAASGLINVSQQLGAAVGLAVLVSVFGSSTGHRQLAAHAPAVAHASLQAVLVHGLDTVFGAGAAFALAALLLVAAVVRMPRPAPVLALEAPEAGEEATVMEAS